ncbi:hypothetical protein TNCV_4456211 [Trichonephila clavipes]|nr:hypothetical protein TNCV_4456211 [Trichonephila clavipes]
MPQQPVLLELDLIRPNHLEKEIEEVDFPIETTHSYPGSSENFTFDDDILHKALFGQWSEWNGQRPPEKVRQKLLQNLPIEKPIDLGQGRTRYLRRRKPATNQLRHPDE